MYLFVCVLTLITLVQFHMLEGVYSWSYNIRVEWGKTPPYCFYQNNHKIKSRSIFIVTMDYVDESDRSFHHESYTGDVPERKQISQ